MQVKKFEAPTLQQALENVKKDLGPDAIILETKQARKGLGILSKGMVEVTAAVPPPKPKKSPRDARASSNPSSAPLGAGSAMAAYRTTAPMAARSSGSTPGRPSSGFGTPSPPVKRKITEKRYIEIDAPPVPQSPAVPAVPSPQALSSTFTAASPARAAIEMREAAEKRDQMHQELDRLRQEIAEVRASTRALAPGTGISARSKPVEGASIRSGTGSAGAAEGSDELWNSVSDRLIGQGVDRRIAKTLIEKARFELTPHANRKVKQDDAIEAIAEEIMRSAKVVSGADILTRARAKKRLVLMGPAGGGKSILAAKLAARCKGAVGLLGIVSGAGVNAIEQKSAMERLNTLGKLMQIPCRTAMNLDELKVCLEDMESLELLIIECQLSQPGDPQALAGLKKMIEALGTDEIHLVLPIVWRDAELFDACAKFQALGPKSLLASRLDEAVVFGNILNVAERAKLPWSFFSTGSKVPNDLEEATVERVASLILDI